jgi:NADH dehydrogenase
MKHDKVLVLGGAGFIGRHIVNQLTLAGKRVLVPARRRDHAKHLILLPTCDVVQADVNDDSVLRTLVRGQDAVVNLIGILHGTEDAFERVHAELPRRVVAACADAGVRRLLHMSALGADAAGPSRYLRSKGRGEAAVRAGALAWTIFQPSVVFGAEDQFLNLFGRLARWMPVLPIGGAEVRFQPVWVQDVARACVNSLDHEATHRRAYELAGPRIYTLRELVRFAAEAAGHPRPVLGLPAGVARAQAALMEMLPGPTLLSRDNLDSMQHDNVASTQPYAPAPELDVAQPMPLEPIAAHYLQGRQARQHFDVWRGKAHR